MSNTTVLVLDIPILLMTIMVMVIAFYLDRKRPVIRSFLFLCATAIGWQCATMVYLLSKTEKMATILFDAKLLFTSFAALALFQFVLRFYHIDQYTSRQMTALMSVIPAITALLTITYPWHSLIRSSFEVVSLWPKHVVVFTRGIWYWVHCFYSYALYLIAAIVSVSQHIKIPKSKRVPSMLIIVGSAASIVCTVLSPIDAVIYPFNLSAISVGMAVIIFYFALRSYTKMDFLVMVRKEIFDFLDDAGFILDSNGKILDANQSAKRWMADIEIATPVTRFKDIMDGLERTGARFYTLDLEQGTDVSLTTSGKTAVYNIREKTIMGEDGYELGKFVICSDVTRNRMRISHLEMSAELDALTGLQNRWALNHAGEILAEKRRTPISLIIGDVNGLKAINDKYGHQKGDLLLQETANVLKAHCPPRGGTYRMGGDEFIMLIPECGGEEAQAIIDDIHRHLNNEPSLFHIEITLAYATEKRHPYSLDNLIELADAEMYKRKRGARATQWLGEECAYN